MEKRKLYIGLDIGTKYAMVSYCMEGMKEPETVSKVAGSEIYQIPQLLYKREGLGQWFYGEEAAEMAKKFSGILLDNLYVRAGRQEEITLEGQNYTYLELFTLFVKKLLTLPAKLDPNVTIEQLVITTEALNRENMELFSSVMEKLDITPGHFSVIDYPESFYYYAMSQKQELWLHNAVMFDYRKSDLKYVSLERNRGTVPQVVALKEQNLGPLPGNKDTAFYDVLRGVFGKRIISAVYLTGDGFDGEWMQESLRYLCSGRRVFLGKNLYAKGASYAASVLGGIRSWDFVYMGENELKFNISLKVKDKGNLAFYSLISAGENWYDAKGECEILLSGTPEIDFWLQAADSREARIDTLELTDLPGRPDKMTRLRITAKPLTDHKVKVVIRDLGFGEIYKSSDKTWEYVMEG